MSARMTLSDSFYDAVGYSNIVEHLEKMQAPSSPCVMLPSLVS